MPAPETRAIPVASFAKALWMQKLGIKPTELLQPIQNRYS